MNGDGRRVEHSVGPSRARAWRCPRCTRLTIRLDHHDGPQVCDHGCGPEAGAMEEIPLQPARKPW